MNTEHPICQISCTWKRMILLRRVTLIRCAIRHVPVVLSNFKETSTDKAHEPETRLVDGAQ